MDVKLIFRKKLPEYFSMENVFGILLPSLKKHVTPEVIHAKTHKGTPTGILKNLLQLRKTKGDVFHVTGDIHYTVFAFPSRKVILTIHDCVFLHNTKGLRKFVMLWFWHKFPVWYANMITTISDASKKDIIKITGCAGSKIKVIGNPVDPEYVFHPKSFNSIKPVILQMGTWPNKNLERVVPALKGIDCHLSVIGHLSPEQKDLLSETGIEYSNHYALPKHELIKKYIECDLVLFVSTFEGFGLPVLESQATGRPLITSDISPMKEVAGNGAHLVNPYNIDVIREGILKVINDGAYREKLVKEGVENVKRYHPDYIASLYLELYKEIAAAG